MRSPSAMAKPTAGGGTLRGKVVGEELRALGRSACPLNWTAPPLGFPHGARRAPSTWALGKSGACFYTLARSAWWIAISERNGKSHRRRRHSRGQGGGGGIARAEPFRRGRRTLQRRWVDRLLGWTRSAGPSCRWAAPWVPPYNSGTATTRCSAQLCNPSAASCTPLAPSRRSHGNASPVCTWRRKSSHCALNALS